MKSTIRQGVFETNSSSTHACVILPVKEYMRWKNENLYIVPLIDEETATSSFVVMTYDELKNKYLDEYLKESSTDKITKDNFSRDSFEYFLDSHYNIVRYDQFGHCYYGYLETDKTLFTTPSGDVMVAYCYYGYDG